MPSRTCGTMTISLPTAMLAKIEHARQVEDRTRSEFVRQAIRVYLAHNDAERRFAENGDGASNGARGRDKDAADDDGLPEDGRVDPAAGKLKERI